MSLVGKKFIVDPGHGGAFDGVTSGSQKEKDITLAIGLALRTKLQAAGATVYMTRTTDVDFGGSDANEDVNNRVAYINSLPAVHGLLSIHINTTTGRVGTFYHAGYTGSQGFADAVAARLFLLSYVGDFAVTRDTTVANGKILVECGRIGQSALTDPAHHIVLADAMTQGCDDYFG